MRADLHGIPYLQGEGSAWHVTGKLVTNESFFRGFDQVIPATADTFLCRRIGEKGVFYGA